MRKRSVIILLIIFAVSFFSYKQTAKSEKFVQSKNKIFAELKPQNVKAAAFAVSKRVSDFAPAQPETGKTSQKMGRAEEQARAVPNKEIFRKQDKNAVHDADAAMADFSLQAMPQPSLFFQGLSSSDNHAAYGFRIVPPDPNGDVGANHYVQSVNSLTRIYDKKGNAVTAPFKLSSIFSALETPCSKRDDGDPIVLYDALADRWFLSQFCRKFPPFRQLIAVSKTSDPAGEYFVYEFVMPNNKLNDYSKIAVWHDGYYMATDEFFGGDFAGTGVFAFDREKILAGDSSASYIYFDLASPSTIRLGGLLPSDLDGLNAPPKDAPNIFIGYTATEYGDQIDAIRLFEFRADFANPNNSAFSERSESPLLVAAFDPTSPDGRSDINQPAPGEKLDSQSDRLMFRAAYRNLGAGVESLVVNQTVRTSPLAEIYRAGVRLYELRKTNGSFAVKEQTTIGDAESSRWMGSAAQDHEGNLAVGYSFVSDEKPPSIFYTGKLANEPGGSFRSEAVLVRGTGVQKAFGFRWGDYTAMNVDPVDDCTFWLTNEYYTLESQNESDFGWLTGIGKFRFAECQNAARASIDGKVTNAKTGEAIANAKVTANAIYSRRTNETGNFGEILLVPNTYILEVSAKGFRSQTVTVTIADGANVTQNFALEPTAVLQNSQIEITAESCSLNNAIEPGETVTVEIPLQNTGAIDAENLTATLLETDAVLNPGEPQNYGKLAANGEIITRPFSFTASNDLNCGDELILVFRLQDGRENLGTIEIKLNAGGRKIALRENFDDVTAPNLPNGWTSSKTGAAEIWKTSEKRFETATNSVFSPDVRGIGLNELVTPEFFVSSERAELEFRNWYELETTFLQNRFYDGSVLEIKIGAANWQDILAAGGEFLAGGYDGAIDDCCQNPLAGRLGWSGTSGINEKPEFIQTKAKLPRSAAGKNVRLRWRIGTDVGTSAEGQYVDNVVVSDGFVCSCAVSQTKRAPFDFDGDGKTDLSIFRPSDSADAPDFLIRQSTNNLDKNAAWGSVGDTAVNADYDGDGKTDLAVYRPKTSTWFILQSSDNVIKPVNFGLPGDKLAPADFDGDARADVAVFRPLSGVWYILNSSDSKVRIVKFGTAEDLPVQADYDQDGKTDLAIFRPSNGTWYVLNSSDNSAKIVRFGLSGDKPVAGDFDGDSKADFVVFRPAQKVWYLLKTSEGFSAVEFGLPNDRPLQADFDADGKRDIAVFRQSTGVWYYLRSSDGKFVFQNFGAAGDAAVPSVFIY